MNKHAENRIVCILFVSIVAFFFISTIVKMPPILINILNESSDSGKKGLTEKFENAYRENNNKRNNLIDIFGLSQNV